ncbi:alpha/beta fold hydrolase [Alcanivorax sp. 1008]|uniref:alpha/beta fold hydrolase n=1 Tax=Alcanivorax sp. 1008 TaxID=2816853 RepID=UPI001D684906|nr:alpha/beta fold hydrolase [Alcanivorax sp. 1008]MCC1497378.1 alpha/beta fold hydrolase [Alcanivorax sp. 1008]
MHTATTQVLSNGISLLVHSWGDPGNTPLLLVHGYPDNHRVWQPVAERLADRFYVIAYDVRGAGGSDVPVKLSDYRMEQLSRDLLAVVDALIPGRQFHLAGHDWGSIQSWESVTTEPLKSRILSFTTISGPSLDHMGYWMRKRFTSLSWREQRKALRQLVSSWYIMFFQLPVIPPLSWRLGLGKWWPTYLEKREGVCEAAVNPTQAKDGQYGVNLYRANFQSKLLNPQPRYAAAPVQLIVPTGDNYVGTQLFEDLHEWVPQLYRRDIDANHWVPLSHADIIARWIAEFAEAVDAGKLSQWSAAHLK